MSPDRPPVLAKGSLYPVEGEALVRFIYIDEAGTSEREPVRVVCAVVVHGDTELLPLARSLHGLMDQVVPPEHRKGFAFHGKELMNGGKAFPRDKYTPEKRLGILGRLMLLTAQADIPVFFGYANSKLQAPNRSAAELVRTQHQLAFVLAIAAASRYVQERFPNEVCQVVAENTPEMQRHLQSAFTALINGPNEKTPKELLPLFPIRNVKPPVYFADKRMEPLLQIADAHAYAIRRFASKGERGERLMEIFRMGQPISEMQYDPREHPFGHFGRFPAIEP